MAKTKRAKKNRATRRKKEILKAHANTSVRGQFSELVSKAANVDSGQQPKKLSHRLHMREIVTDLVKTAIFAVLVVAFLFILKSQNLEFDLSVYK